MRNQTEIKLRALFDYQKFEQEPELKSVIEGTRRKIVPLSDEDLVFAAAGTGGPAKRGEPEFKEDEKDLPVF